MGRSSSIPSIKWFWYEKMKPNYTEEEVISWKNSNDGPPFEWGQGVDGYYELGETYLTRDGKSVAVPHCNQCQCQPNVVRHLFMQIIDDAIPKEYQDFLETLLLNNSRFPYYYEYNTVIGVEEEFIGNSDIIL